MKQKTAMSLTLLEEYRGKQTVFSISRLTDTVSEWEYWLSRPIRERWEAMELLRQSFCGDDATTRSFPRILEFGQLKSS